MKAVSLVVANVRHVLSNLNYLKVLAANERSTPLALYRKMLRNTVEKDGYFCLSCMMVVTISLCYRSLYYLFYFVQRIQSRPTLLHATCNFNIPTYISHIHIVDKISRYRINGLIVSPVSKYFSLFGNAYCHSFQISKPVMLSNQSERENANALRFEMIQDHSN